MEATACAVEGSVKAVKVTPFYVIPSVNERVTPFSCPSIAGSSLSAVSPDYDFIGGMAYAA